MVELTKDAAGDFLEVERSMWHEITPRVSGNFYKFNPFQGTWDVYNMLRSHERPSGDRIVATRIALAPITPADAVDMVEVLSGAELYSFIGGSAPSLNELRERYIRLAVGRSPDGRQEWYNWVVRHRLDGQAMGTVQATVFDDGQRAEIAWIVGLRWQRQGYATEAAQALVDWLDKRGVPCITAHVHPSHQASITVASRIGLPPTGHFYEGERLWQRGDVPSDQPQS